MADAWDLKSHGRNPVPVRPRSPAPYRGVEQLVARRAHNPEAAGSSPVSATKKHPVSLGKWGVFRIMAGQGGNRMLHRNAAQRALEKELALLRKLPGRKPQKCSL